MTIGEAVEVVLAMIGGGSLVEWRLHRHKLAIETKAALREGHALKASDDKTARAIESLSGSVLAAIERGRVSNGEQIDQAVKAMLGMQQDNRRAFEALDRTINGLDARLRDVEEALRRSGSAVAGVPGVASPAPVVEAPSSPDPGPADPAPAA